jgi:hypothetical protein
MLVRKMKRTRARSVPDTIHPFGSEALDRPSGGRRGNVRAGLTLDNAFAIHQDPRVDALTSQTGVSHSGMIRS